MPDNSAEIAELESLINGATSETSVDGTVTKSDLEFARKRLAELRMTDTASIQSRMVKPRIARIRLDSF